MRRILSPRGVSVELESRADKHVVTVGSRLIGTIALEHFVLEHTNKIPVTRYNDHRRLLNPFVDCTILGLSEESLVLDPTLTVASIEATRAVAVMSWPQAILRHVERRHAQDMLSQFWQSCK